MAARFALVLLLGLSGALSAAVIVVNDDGDALHSPGCATAGTGTQWPCS